MSDTFRQVNRSRSSSVTVRDNGIVHLPYRVIGPSLIFPHGAVHYTNSKGKLHRTNGPAVTLADGSKDYWVNDKFLTPEEFFIKYGVIR